MLSFAHPVYLWFLLGMLVPVALHLLNLRRLQRLVFPSVRFLRVSQQPQEGRRRLRDLLLLCLRMLVVGLLALLLAGPRWEESSSVSAAAPCVTRVLFLDASSSMSVTGRWERARDLADSFLSQGGEERLGLVVSDGVSLTVVPPTQEPWRVREALNYATVSHYAGEHAKGLSEAVRLLREAGGGKLEVISDFQAGDWERPFKLVPEGIELTLHDVKAPQPSVNCGISGVTCHRLDRERLRVVVSVDSSAGEEQIRDLVVRVGEKDVRKRLVLAPRTRLRVSVILDPVPQGGSGVAELTGDEYSQDDQWYFWGDGDPPRRVLVVTDASSSSDSQGEGVFVHQALVSQGGRGSSFQVSSADVSMVESSSFASCHAVFLLGCAHGLTDDGLQGVSAVLSRGGVLFVTPSSSPGSDLARLRDLGIDFGQVSGIRGESELPEGVGLVARDSVLWPLFKEQETCDLYMFPIRRRCRLKVSAGTGVLLEGLSGAPLLVERSQGSGRCFFMSLGFSSWWGDAQLTNSFLPLLHELLLSSLTQVTGRRRLPCGTVSYDQEGVPLDTVEPGVFLDGLDYVEVNVDRREAQARSVGKLDMMDLLLQEQQTGERGGLARHDSWSLAGVLSILLLLAFLGELLLSLGYDWKSTEQRLGGSHD